MFAFIERLLPKKDPEAVDWKLVRKYLRTHRRFDRVYNSNAANSFSRSRELFHQMQDLRASANRATVGEINQAFGLPSDHCNPSPVN